MDSSGRQRKYRPLITFFDSLIFFKLIKIVSDEIFSERPHFATAKIGELEDGITQPKKKK